MKKYLIVFGTRPEAIKMAPVIKEIKKRRKYKLIICVTAQHREMLDLVLIQFGIKPNYDLDLMINNQGLAALTSRIIIEITKILEKEKPDLVLVQGDTTTAFVSTLAAFYQKIPVGHIEAGLRTTNKLSPFPEEINRRGISLMANYHFAPTAAAKQCLVEEGISESDIFITGNTVIDSLKSIVNKVDKKSCREKWEVYFGEKYQIKFNNYDKIILVTGHRRESFGEGFINICKALLKIAYLHPEILIIYPVHLNPNVERPVFKILGKQNNIKLLPPLDYEPFVFLMNKSYLILTDSGGIQEEAAFIGKPVLVMRNNTERMEAVNSGSAILVGTNVNRIIMMINKVIKNTKFYKYMANSTSPYGDGNASKYIVDILSKK